MPKKEQVYEDLSVLIESTTCRKYIFTYDSKWILKIPLLRSKKPKPNTEDVHSQKCKTVNYEDERTDDPTCLEVEI